MTDKEQLKAAALRRIDANRDLLLDLVERIAREPETGYREVQTARLVEQAFERFGIPCTGGLALTGVKGEIAGGAGPGPSVCVMGELDALIVPDHLDAHPERQTAHACGQNGQIGAMLGAAIGLQADDVLPSLSGRVVAVAVPAEECIEIGHRLSLRDQGAIEFILGKPELVRIGALDDVDMAMMGWVWPCICDHTLRAVAGYGSGGFGVNAGLASTRVWLSAVTPGPLTGGGKVGGSR